MEKQDILKVVRANEGTVLSFPDRGPWGNNRYRGNCSGYIHAFLIDQYDVNYMAEMYAGGGTGYDVCKDMPNLLCWICLTKNVSNRYPK